MVYYVGQDRFVPLPGSSGSTGAAFRTHSLQQGEVGHDAAAAAFFAGHPQHSHSSPLNLQSLQHALPQAQQHQLHSPAPMPAWAADFMQSKPASPAVINEAAWQNNGRPASGQAVPMWARDFASQSHLSPAASPLQHSALPGPGFQHHQAPMFATQQDMQVPWSGVQQPGMHYNSTYQQDTNLYVAQQTQIPLNTAQDASTKQIAGWEEAFQQHIHKSSLAGSEALSTTESPHESLTARPASPTQIANANDSDLLAKIAGELLENVSTDMSTNDKMRNSSFMSLMRKLRDKEAVVEGDKMIDRTQDQSSMVSENTADPLLRSTSTDGPQPVCVWPNQVREHLTSPGAAQTANISQTVESLSDAYEEMNAALDEGPIASTSRLDPMRAFQGDGGRLHDEDYDNTFLIQEDEQTGVLGASSSWEEDFDFDTQLLRSGPAPPNVQQSMNINAQQQEWGDLQHQWDAFPATATGLDALNTASYSNYPFHSRNPYLLSNSRQHLPENTLLEKEADVQLSPENAGAWLSLGLKQQENEREPLAIQALLRALELDSSLSEAWLALAVSYTNDNLRGKAYSSIENWADLQSQYAHVVRDYTARMNGLGQGPASAESLTLAQRHTYLTGLLVEMARAGAGQEGDVDAEVQIALGVLFNASEEYEKACDCFSAALSVRPEVRYSKQHVLCSRKS